MSTDTILIRGLAFECIVGILPYEREQQQPLSIDIDLQTDFTRAAATEDVAFTVDYAQVSELVIEQVQRKQYWLLETMAHQILDMLFERFDQVTAARVLIEKPNAVETTKWVGVESSRKR